MTPIDAYLDSSVLAAVTLGEKDRNFEFAGMVFDRMEGGRIRGRVSPLTMMETVGVTRRRMASRAHHYGARHDSSSMLRSEIERREDAFFLYLGRMEEEGKIMLGNLNIPVSEFHGKSLRVLLDHEWGLHEWGRAFVYSGLDHWDCQHAVTAREWGCALIYSADAGFRRIQDMPGFGGIEIITPDTS